MRMTTKLASLLTILFVFFKFGEPAQVMMSIYGDKSFLFHSEALTADQLVGFVYEDTNGAFSVANCTAATKTYFKLKDDCTVLSVLARAKTTDASGATEADALIDQRESDFPEASVNTNIMVARIEASGAIVTKTKAVLAGATDTTLITLTPVVSSGGGSVTPNEGASTFLCNNLDGTTTKGFLTADGTTFGQVDSVATSAFPAMMKCVGAARDAVTGSDTTATNAAFSTFILIVTDIADLTSTFSSLAFPSVVLLPQTVNQTTNASIPVGYINVKNACPTSTNFTFSSSPTTPCKGTISMNALGTDLFLTFIYGGATHYLPVADASGATTCPATSTTTCEDFAFNFKYSNTLIGMLLIFMLKMLQSY